MQRYGDYELERELGRGATARVYLARELNTHETVSLKIFHPKLFDEPMQLSRIQREVEVAASLQHPNIVCVRAVLRNVDPPALVMDFIDGENLEIFQSRLPYTLPEVSLLIVIEILKALEYAHEKGLVHRDLKPENVLVRKDGHIFVTDFGLAKWSDATQMTKSNTILGSLDYLAPEQARGDRYTILSDLFSVGAILYFLTTGTRPFARETPFATLTAIQEERPESPEKRNPKLSAELSRLMLKAIHPVPAERFQNAREFQMALRTYLDSIGLTEAHFTLGVWVSDPRRGSTAALNLVVERLIQNAENALEVGQRDSLLESLGHLSLKAPGNPAISRITQSYRTLRKRTREKVVAAFCLLLIPVYFYLAKRHFRKPVPAPFSTSVNLPKTETGTVRFNVSPDIEVYWDDVRVSPSEPLPEQTIGDHQLLLKRKGQKPIRAKVQVKATEPTVVNVK